MSVLVNLIVCLIVLGLLWYLVKLLPLPSPINTVVDVLFIILAIFAVLSVFGALPGLHFPVLLR